ncbi:MAG: Holliday junction resolvase RuvX [Candidatus Dormibacteraeota bacterium]|nr:Holliday junction resolvase RuvX [Candidatus Dormibacteraeota bacterium]
MTRVLAVDPGTKRVGLALSDPSRTIAQPLASLPAEPSETLPGRVAALAAENDVGDIVVGLPRRLDGSNGPEALAARELAGALRQASGLRVTLVDERLTSVAAERALLAAGESRRRRRELSDRVAAALILQQHLDREARRGGR